MDYIGMDVHKRETQVCIIDGEGAVRLEQRIRTEPGRLADVRGARPRTRVLLEASTQSEWVAATLEALGHEVVVANPNDTPSRVRDYSRRGRSSRDKSKRIERGLPGTRSRKPRASRVKIIWCTDGADTLK